MTLSACDTGTGEAEDRIGVRGLRRGFFRAGARNLVTTLWPVRDEETSRFMLDFYSRLKSEPAERALPLVQREWLSRLKASAGPDEAITVAGPFLLHSRGGLARGR